VTLLEQRNATLIHRITGHSPGDIGVAVVTVEESLRGRLATVARARDGPARIDRYRLLRATVQLFLTLPVAEYDRAAENQFQQLRALRLGVGSQDLKIAAIALSCRVTLVTRNSKDFGKVPALVIEDWSI
jgi:tRNA(fMet)-specific endonuclease VapC